MEHVPQPVAEHHGPSGRDTAGYVCLVAALENILGPKEFWVRKSPAQMQEAFSYVPGWPDYVSFISHSPL
jgi:hypothetical protein